MSIGEDFENGKFLKLKKLFPYRSRESVNGQSFLKNTNCPQTVFKPRLVTTSMTCLIFVAVAPVSNYNLHPNKTHYQSLVLLFHIPAVSLKAACSLC